MKKFLITCLTLMTFVLPSLAQVDHDYNLNDVTTHEVFDLKIDQIPPAVLKAANIDFNLNNPLTWSKFPYAIHEYGWVYDKAASDVNPDRYEVSMKSEKGNNLYAVYSAEGNLIATREMITNAPIPSYVKEALLKSKYKDWQVVGDKEIIRYFHDKNSVEQHFRLTVEKNNIKRSISFNYQASANK
ncbi:MAG: hypothetical protein Q8859_12320 [Bacteroidota bacterium]|nr:hypothetical protein [Bacteroidota bacterium]